jgi:tetratricopeptide (TPR) repeat protein
MIFLFLLGKDFLCGYSKTYIMKKTVLILLLLTSFSGLIRAQQKEAAEKIVNDAVTLQDKGDLDGALTKLNEALALDADNLYALSEMASTYIGLQKYNESVETCKKAIAKHPGDDDLKGIYIAYGTALDGLGKKEEAIQQYDEGIKLFPASFLLYFNKGITLTGIEKYDDALQCFHKSVSIYPQHAGSNNAIARLLAIKNKRIPSILAFSRFLIIEPKGGRAQANLEYLQKLLMAGVEQKGKKNITISIDAGALGDTTADGKPAENSFSNIELMLSLTSGLDYDKEHKNETEVEKFIRKFDMLCDLMSTSQKDHFGFYWDYYVPYFLELKEKKYMETFANIVYYSTGEKSVLKWVEAHSAEVADFYKWDESFSWKGLK